MNGPKKRVRQMRGVGSNFITMFKQKRPRIALSSKVFFKTIVRHVVHKEIDFQSKVIKNG